MSMTRETAAEWFETHMPTGRVKPVQKQAYLLALSALRPVSREQVEKVWRGEWQYHPEDYDELTWTCSRCGEVWTLIDGTPDDNNMDFCPACGSPTTDEAVEMVMERMEKLHEDNGCS